MEVPGHLRDRPHELGGPVGDPVGVPPASTDGGERARAHGVSVGEVLGTAAMGEARLLAGEAGLDRRVGRVVLMTGRDGNGPPRAGDLLVVPSVSVLLDVLGPGSARRAGLEDLSGRAPAGLVVTGAPAGLLEWADRVRIPIVGVHEEAYPDGDLRRLPGDVLAELLARRAGALERVDRVHAGLARVLGAGGSLQDTVAELARLLDAAVLVATADGRVLASCGVETLSEQRRRALFFRGRARPAGQALGLHPDPTNKGSHVVAAVPPSGGEVTRMVAVSEGTLLGPAEIQAMESAATAIALALARRATAAAAERRHHNEVVAGLISGSLPTERADAAAAAFGWDLRRPLRVIVSRLEASDDGGAASDRSRARQDRFTAAWSGALRSGDPRAAVVGFAEEVVCLLGAGAEQATPIRQVAAVVDEAGIDHAEVPGWEGLTTGISRVTSLHGVAEGYEQARRAMTVGRQVHGPGSVTDFDALGVHRLLSLVPGGAELRRFVRETLGELVTREDPETRDLRETLEILLENNLNVAETARRQHFHYNTLRYRISKLERILGPFTDDPDLRLTLMLALQVVRMRGEDFTAPDEPGA